MTGDGCVYYQSKKIKHTMSIQYFNNMPYYLSYKLEPLRNESYKIKVEEAKENNEQIKTILSWKDTEKKEIDCEYDKPLKLTLDIMN